MSHDDEEDKPTVVLDLNALKKQKLVEEENLANVVEEIEFDVLAKADEKSAAIAYEAPKDKRMKIILFDLESDFFKKSMKDLPLGHSYIHAKTLEELNSALRDTVFQILVMNYDANAKAVNQLVAQVKKKFPHTKVLIVARDLNPERVAIHAKTPSGASGYYQLPIEPKKIQKEFEKIKG